MVPIEGTARRVRIQDEGVDTVLRFVLESDQTPNSIPVEMRGQQILGILNEDDRVSLSVEGSVRDQDGVARPQQIQNLTVQSRVRVSRSRWPSRVVTSPLASAIISAIVGSITTVIAGGFGGRDLNFSGGEILPQPWTAIVFGLVTALSTFYILRIYRQYKGPLRPPRNGH